MNIINLIIPELAVFISAVSLLIFGVFRRGSDNMSLIARLLAMVLFATASYSAIYLDAMLSANSIGVHNFIVASSALIHLGKILILFTSGTIMLMLAQQKQIDKLELPVLLAISAVGMMLTIASHSLLTLYMGLEMMSLPLYIMAASDTKNSNSHEAGLKYFILGCLASGLFLYGVSLVYGYTGQLGFHQLTQYFTLSLGEADSTNFPIGLLLGLIFITVALAFKMSVVPFHMWTPDVYQGAPTVVTAFFATSAKAAVMFLFIRLMLEPFEVFYPQWVPILFFMSVGSMLVGALGALIQKNIKRMLAYSSIGHIGFALVGLVSGDAVGISGMLTYIILYLTMSVGTFAMLLLAPTKDDQLAHFSGLSNKHPIFAMMLTLLLLSMAGIPPLAGFFAKFYVLLPVMKQQLYFLAFVFIVASVISCFYYLQVIKIMYFDKASANKTTAKILNDRVLWLIAVLMVVLNLTFPLFADSVLSLTQKVASLFLL